MEGMEEEEEIPVKYRLRGETDWQVKKEAVMKLGKTEWAIRLKLCKQGDDHQYYSLHVVLLTPGKVSRIQIKCTREGETKTDWQQEYTFGSKQSTVVNPCLMKVGEQRDKVTFVVEIKQLCEYDNPILELPDDICFPNSDYALTVGTKKLHVDSEYLKRRAPLLGYMFEDEEKKEYEVDNVDFADLVDAFGVFQHRWEFPAERLLTLIPIARKLGFDVWGPALNREFSQLVYRADPVKIVAKEAEEIQEFQFNTTLKLPIEDVEAMGASTIPDNQNHLVTWEEQNRNCLIYTYTQEILGQKYFSLGFQMSRPSTSDSDSRDGDDEVNVTDDDDARSGYSESNSESKFFDIEIHLINDKGERLISDRIRRIRDDEYTIVGSPVFALFEDVLGNCVDGRVELEFNFVENLDDEDEDNMTPDENLDFEGDFKLPPKIRMPGVTNGEIQCEGRIIQINREYLSHHSEYFRGLFSKRFKEGQMDCITLPAEHLNTLCSALDLLYNRRLVLSDVEISRVLDFSDRVCLKTLTDGLQSQLWNSKVMDVGDKKWLAEQFMLTDLEIKCTMEQNEEMLRAARASRKRTRPADFQDEPLDAPPPPNPERVLQELPDMVMNEQMSS